MSQLHNYVTPGCLTHLTERTDETRFGLKTIQRHRLTLKGIKPIGEVQWVRKIFYLYGVVEPQTFFKFFLRVLPSRPDLL